MTFFLCQVVQPVEDVLDDGFCSVLIKVAIFSHLRLEITLITKFRDYVAVSITGKNFKTSEHIRVTQFLENVDLREEQLLKLLAFEGF